MLQTSLISSFFTLASFKTCSTGFMVFLKRSMLSSSNLARVSVSEKSLPSSKLSISISVLCWLESILLAFSTYLTLEFSESAEILGNIGTSFLLVGLDHVIDDTVVEIFSTEMGVTSGSQDLKDTIVDRKQGYIECSSSKIVDNNLRFTSLLVETVGNGGGCRLVYDTKNLETCDCSGVISSLTLSVVEIYNR